MSTRHTSSDVYHQIKEEGLLSKMRFQVYEALQKMSGPATAREIFATMNVDKMEPTRLTELRNWGVIKESGTRECKITGRIVIQWEITGNLPTEPVKKKGRPKGFKNAVKYMIEMMEKNNSTFVTVVQLKKIL